MHFSHEVSISIPASSIDLAEWLFELTEEVMPPALAPIWRSASLAGKGDWEWSTSSRLAALC